MTGSSLPWVLLAGAGFATAESGLGLGVLVPGETVVVGLAAGLPDLGARLALLVAVALGASAGDHLGYAVGRRAGPRMRTSRVVRRLGTAHWDRAADVLERRGATAVVATRLVPVVRTLVPASAGAAGLAYRRFLPASLLGSFLWSGLYVGGGTALAGALERVLAAGATAAVAVLVALAVALLAWAGVRHAHGRGPAAGVRPDDPLPGRVTHRADLAPRTSVLLAP